MKNNKNFFNPYIINWQKIAVWYAKWEFYCFFLDKIHDFVIGNEKNRLKKYQKIEKQELGWQPNTCFVTDSI